jgi:hypothetical protein
MASTDNRRMRSAEEEATSVIGIFSWYRQWVVKETRIFRIYAPASEIKKNLT